MSGGRPFGIIDTLTQNYFQLPGMTVEALAARKIISTANGLPARRGRWDWFDFCQPWWAALVSNQRPLACEASALPLS